MTTLNLFTGVFFFLAAQILRAVRWQLLFPDHLRINKSRLTFYVSIGSLINIFLPFRLGDILRGLILSRLEKISFSSTFISIVIERATDIFAVVLIVILYSSISNHSLTIEYGWLIVGIMVVACGSFLKTSSNFRLCIFWFSSLWNSKIQLLILNFFWLIFLQFRHNRFVSLRYILLTGLMWLCYLGSYAFFYFAVHILKPEQVWNLFHSASLTSASGSYTWLNYSGEVIQYYFLLLLTPIFIAITYEMYSTNILNSFAKGLLHKLKDRSSLMHFGVPSIFSGNVADRNFLFSWFSNVPSLVNEIGVLGFDDCKISRFYHGNSGALVALVEKSQGLFIRKVAKGDAASRLQDQYLLLKSNEGSNLPFVKVYSLEMNRYCTFYEMEYERGSLDMYEWVHSASLENSKKVFICILEFISDYHKAHSTNIVEHNVLLNFYNEKIINNIIKIKDNAQKYISLDLFKINGESFSIDEWDFLSDFNWIESVLDGSLATKVHGDLTLENIIINEKLEWYLIDPNPCGPYSVAAMDWAKLFQSLNMGYENLSRNCLSSFEHNHILFIHNISHRYKKLHTFLLTYLSVKFTKREMMQIELHEIIHYLRLIPYKFNKSPDSGMLFFAVVCLVIRNFRSKYELS